MFGDATPFFSDSQNQPYALPTPRPLKASTEPPSYESAIHSSTPTSTQPLTPFSTHFRSHTPIGIYKTSLSDLLLAPTAHAAPALAYVSTHAWSRPQLELHASGAPTSCVVATAEFHTFSTSTTMRVPGARVAEELARDGSPFSHTAQFRMRLPAAGQREVFEWRNSSGPLVAALGGHSRGLKLVRVATGDVLAVYAPAGLSVGKVGKVQWVGLDEVGEIAELMVVMSLLAVVERARRNKRSSGGAVAAAGAAAGASC